MNNVSQKELQKLKAMVEAKQDLNACVAFYQQLYNNSAISSRDELEEEIEALRHGGDAEGMEATRLEIMLEDNPDSEYFNYATDGPVTYKWLREILEMGEDPQKALNLLKFLQNGNIVRIRDNEEFNRFGYIMLHHGLTPLVKGWAQSYPAQVFQTVKFNGGDRLIKSTEWDGKTFYAECQIGKEAIGIYPYTVRATVEWYGVEPMSVDDIDWEK